MDVLHYLDIAIGFSLCMAVLATLIGTTTAMWLSAVRSRIRNLERGLQLVVGTLNAGLDEKELREAAKNLVRDKMVNAWLPFGLGATEAIGREELVLLLLRKANGEGAWKKIGAAIKTITTKEPASLLQEVELATLQQEAADPNSPSHVWRTKALASVAPQLAARLFAQFDDVMLRTDDNVTYSAKVVSAILAAIFLIVYPIDSLDLLSRLSTNKEAAAALANAAAAKNLSQQQLLAEVKKQDMFGAAFDQPMAKPITDTIAKPGIWITWVLVGLGASFWQGLIEKLLGLRSRITAKTEEERTQRNTKT
ncbi:MAG: hypothetical protein HYX27_14945 [Acidobacteria bacterium]|nr:hypothetical protein [Acidobacteriota bacterium]